MSSKKLQTFIAKLIICLIVHVGLTTLEFYGIMPALMNKNQDSSGDYSKQYNLASIDGCLWLTSLIFNIIAGGLIISACVIDYIWLYNNSMSQKFLDFTLNNTSEDSDRSSCNVQKERKVHINRLVKAFYLINVMAWFVKGAYEFVGLVFFEKEKYFLVFCVDMPLHIATTYLLCCLILKKCSRPFSRRHNKVELVQKVISNNNYNPIRPHEPRIFYTE